AAVLVAVLVVPAGPVVAVVAAVVVGAVTALGAWILSPRLLCWAVGARPARAGEQPRVRNLTASLRAAMGVGTPSLFVVIDPVPNAMVLGTSRRHATLVVTAGLAERLNRIELEGVLAHELAHVKAADQVVGTVAGAVLGPLSPMVPAWRRAMARSAARREARADLAGVRVTRYPPGLRSALEKMHEGPAPALPGWRGWLAAHLWINPPGDDGGELKRRIEALDEL
ncbi:MAG: M48 family metalloprotease, partial [Acidimicrobiales bacterium]|nr:M48 family metalloprotease [Acidimicrobiales bacterium]